MLHRLLYIFPIFRAICECHASKNLPLLLQTAHRAIFSHLRTNRSAAHQVCDTSMQTSGNRKEPSLVSKPYGVERPIWVVPTCREPRFAKCNGALLWRKISLRCHYWYSGLFKQVSSSIQICQLLFKTFSIKFSQILTSHNGPRPSSPTK